MYWIIISANKFCAMLDKENGRENGVFILQKVAFDNIKNNILNIN